MSAEEDLEPQHIYWATLRDTPDGERAHYRADFDGVWSFAGILERGDARNRPALFT